MPAFRSQYVFVFPFLILLHLALSPYTKVEESFNIQAVHDILKYGIPIRDVYSRFQIFYDHMTFSGSVPRTFIGSLVVAGMSKPLICLNDVEGLLEQATCRIMVGMLNAAALVTFAREVGRAYGSLTALWYIFLQMSQFHVFYYASRTLPNMFAFCLTTFAMAYTLPFVGSSKARENRLRRSLFLLTLATVIFRSEMVLLLGSQSLYSLLKCSGLENQISFLRRVIIRAVVIGSVLGIALTVIVDTFFWQSSTPLWPEAAAFIFNIFPTADHEGASAWGTSPWHWYFTSAIPRLSMNPFALLLIPYGLLFTTQKLAMLDNMIPSVCYTILYSILPHKETRFLFPIVPSLTLTTALGASYLTTRRQMFAKLMVSVLAISTIIAASISHSILLPLSALSYPGGHALQTLHNYHFAHNDQNNNQNIMAIDQDHSEKPSIHVHLTNLALQTGITRFLEQPSPPPPSVSITSQENITSSSLPSPVELSQRPTRWTYDKSSNSTLFLTPEFWATFDYVIVEDVHRVIGAWEVIDEVKTLRKGAPKITRAVAAVGRKSKDSTEEEQDELSELIRVMYGSYVARFYGVVRDVVRDGRGVGGMSLTRGIWIDWGLETRLYVLKKKSLSGL